jgi:hypothetical protein
MQRLSAVLLAALLAGATSGAAAQLRTIPPEARAGELRHLQEMIVELDGRLAALSAGAQIRDASNRLLLPSSLTVRTPVRYLVDGEGKIHRAWILSKEEADRLPKPTPKPSPIK